ncbi:DUF5060 domain-containing protein [uncultured Draconibacterium sp.]|uniref:DUF5060 domain-containing protein n=1 Tax=uncultured Draconibacterium sp. TaxID=1573823 RepID=UPI0025F258CF|nr:DUF5060 domain-containing protein [uncultured Draconibacterium sp.]
MRTLIKIQYFIISITLTLLASCGLSKQEHDVEIHGELKQWHKVTLLIQGPETSEWAENNPFLNYRLDVTFSKGDKKYVAPGYFAADGNAGETSAKKGNVWKVHFRPDEPGIWDYSISFISGDEVAVSDKPIGEQTLISNLKGSFEVDKTNKTGKDFRANGRIVSNGTRYFKFSGTNKIWIKNGADSPENFLAFTEFDQTYRKGVNKRIRKGEANPKAQIHQYEPHLDDWAVSDPTWQEEKGKGIIGAINYLASAGVNSVYMLTLNIQGDGNDVWPYSGYNERYRFDCSKLDQWAIVFDHMESLGIMNHFVLQETENECLLDGGFTNVQRRVYLRELIARFGHNLGVTWNLGEENGPSKNLPIGQTEQQIRDMASYIKRINPYPSYISLHTHHTNAGQDKFLLPLLGFQDLDGPSLQVHKAVDVHERVKKWIDVSNVTDKKWMVCLDEIGPAENGVMPDSHDFNHDTVRHHCLWGALMAGAAGAEWYFGYRYPHNDLGMEDFRSRKNWWKQTKIASDFFETLPVQDMINRNDLVQNKRAYCFTNEGDIYVVYLPVGNESSKIKINSNKEYSIKWLNPREGEDFNYGTIKKIKGKGWVSIGKPNSDLERDWVAIIQ